MPSAWPSGSACSPSVTYFLMMGEYPPTRLRGWVALLQVPTADLDDFLADRWAEHGVLLTREAACFDFVPWMTSKRRPKGSSVRAWAAQFLATHEY